WLPNQGHDAWLAPVCSRLVRDYLLQHEQTFCFSLTLLFDRPSRTRADCVPPMAEARQDLPYSGNPVGFDSRDSETFTVRYGTGRHAVRIDDHAQTVRKRRGLA